MNERPDLLSLFSNLSFSCSTIPCLPSKAQPFKNQFSNLKMGNNGALRTDNDYARYGDG